MNFPSNKILIVEDEKLPRNVLQKILIKLGYPVESAESAEKALKILESEKIPLVITDLILPDMDGNELCKRIKKINSESVIYALSGQIAAFEPAKLEEIGFDGYMCKPVKIYVLKRAIEGAFDRIDKKRERQSVLLSKA
ncbi:MAG: response regulator [Desulfobacterales bacterium]|uniref:Response regulator n=1 Tax=Candidatus Desulfatibia vada TaxID=2841696 RepID=A0A8J6P8Q7_9BACT|nr:response regulator [Candidatus Desulfatibia vada]